MPKVLHFEDYLKTDRFREQVILPLLEKNPIYESLRKDNEAIAFLHYHLYIYVYLTYIPYGVQTDLPTVEDSFCNIASKPRISNGEWVIEEFYRLKKEDALSIYPLIYAKNKKENWYDHLKVIIREKAELRIKELEEEQNKKNEEKQKKLS
ncbi:hypothetical protein MZM54_00905 [[Brevibacterium] frigoritolerans]|nr:hypothetical protein [Peribacillus frigoritolerans]